MVKSILFDIDDTLFPSTEFSSLARKNAITAMISMGLKYDFKTLDSKLTAIIKKRGSNYQGHFNDLCRQLRVKHPEKYIAAAIASYHDTKASIQPFPKIPQTLLHLKEKGYKIYAASSGNSIKQWDKLIRLGLAFYFDGVFVTEKGKNTGFYKKILRTLNIRAEDCIMVGDREDQDIKAAKAAGIKTIRVLTGKYSKIPSKADFVLKNPDDLVSIFE